MLAATGSIDLARLLLDLLIVLVAAKIAGELAERMRVPAVLGEIAAGIVIGPSVLGIIELNGDRGVSIAFLAEIGVLLLLLSVGMEMDLGELGKVGATALTVAVIGVVVPFAAGLGVALAFDQSTNAAIFFGAALTATSVGITARVFGDLRALATAEARIVLGAAVADDVFGLIILTVVVKVVTGGDVGVGTIAETLGLAVLFLAGTGLLGVFVIPRVFRAINRFASSTATLVVAAFVLMVGFAMLADAAKLAFIIGAFMAGLALGRTDHHERITSDLGAVSHVFVPVFFLSIGINADLDAMAKGSVIVMALALTAVAVAGKLVAGLGVRGRRADRLLIGLGMIPRGEVGLIFASIGLSNAVLDGDQYGALLIVVLLTTLITPPLLRARLGRAPDSLDDGAAALEPSDGWLTTVDGEVALRALPPSSVTVALALQVARRAAHARPSDELLNWFATHRMQPLLWEHRDTPALVELLRIDEPLSWRFLDVTGVLERALPEIATAMRRRRANMSDLDPLGALRFATVDRLHDVLVEAPLAAPGADHHVALAALVADVGTTRTDEQQLAERLAADVEAQRIISIVEDARVLHGRAHDTAGLDQTELLHLATHLATESHARDAIRLARALSELTPAQNERLDALTDLIIDALAHPELLGSDASNLAGARRAAAERLLTDPAPIERLRHAATTHLLAHPPDVLARQARLVEPLPRPGVVRVAVSPEPEPDHWTIDVACRDTDGLLARLTDVLADCALLVVRADIATWPDGAVLDSFVVRSTQRPSARDLGDGFERRLRGSIPASAASTATIRFDNDAVPWLTVCSVTGDDVAGTLRCVAHAFAAADVVVHTARLSPTGDPAAHRFMVADRFNRKLDERAMQRVRSVLAAGSGRRRSR